MFNRYRVPSLHELTTVFVYRPKYVWLGILVPLVAISGCVALGVCNGWELDWSLKVAGFLIGFAGLVVVGSGLHRTRRLFREASGESEQPKPSGLKDWLRAVRSLFVKPERRDLHIHVPLGGITLKGHAATVTVGAKTLEQRVKDLEDRAAAAEKRAEEIRTEARQELEKARAELRTEDSRLQKSVNAVAELLEKVSVGGLDLEGTGLVWLMLGSFLTTLNDWVATWGIWRAFV